MPKVLAGDGPELPLSLVHARRSSQILEELLLTHDAQQYFSGQNGAAAPAAQVRCLQG